MEIRILLQTDVRSEFRSGDPDLDRFFTRFAGQNQFRHHIGTTYIATEGGKTLGYATVAAGQIEGESVKTATRRQLPRYPLPVLRLARLAVDESAQDKGLGKALLRFVLVLASKMSREFGCIGVLVDAKPHAVAFYGRYGFEALDVLVGRSDSRPPPQLMFLSLALIELAIGSDT